MEREIGVFGIADFFAGQRRKRPNFLDVVNDMVQWKSVEKILHKKLKRNTINAVGVKAYPALVMFKILLLQSWFTLSDEDMEFALHDRISFARFTGFSLEDETPDHTTICRFRNLLVEKKLLHTLLNEINNQLMRQGKLVKKGCAIDASIISSASRPTKQVNIDVVAEDRQEEDTPPPAVTVSYSKDVDASWTKKGQRYYYGYKIHVATDITDGFVLAGHATAAHKSDTGEFASVIDAASLHQKTRAYADKGYTSEKNRKILQERGLKDGIMNKAVRGRKLTVREQQRNRLISGPRGIIERGFGTLKRVYGLARASYRGLAKVEGEFLLCAMAFNLKKAVFLPSP